MPPEKPYVDVCLMLKPQTEESGGYVLEAYEALQTESTPPRASATLLSLSSLDSSCWAGALKSICGGDSRGLQQMGNYLAEWLFIHQPGTTPNAVGTYLQERSAHIKRPQHLRVWLRLDRALPHRNEFRRGFLPLESLEHNSIVPVRVLRGVVSGASTSQPLEVADKLRVLLVYANPAEDKAPPGSPYPHLQGLRQHFDLLCRTLEPLVFEEALFREVLHSPAPEQLQAALTRLNPHVLVFVGHGYSTDGGGLVCVRNGVPEEWAFPELVQAIHASQEPALRLGVFMACRSFVAAPSLLTAGVPVVLAMQPLADTDFPEQSVPVFAGSFFRVLAYLGPISDAYENACRALASSEMPVAALMPTLWLATPYDNIFASPEERLRARYLDALGEKLPMPLPPSPIVAGEANFSTVYVDQSGIEERQAVHSTPTHDAAPAAQATGATGIQGGVQRVQVDLWEALTAYHRMVLVDPAWREQHVFYQWIAQQCFEQTGWLPILVNLRDFIRRRTTLRRYLAHSYAESLGLKGYHIEVRQPHKRKQRRSVGHWLLNLWQAGEALLILDGVDTRVTPELRDKVLSLLPAARLSAVRPYVLWTSDALGEGEGPPEWKLAYIKRTHGIFLSYDWEDRPEVREVIAALRSRGIAVTWDQDWPCWNDYDAEIKRAIRQADDVLLYSTSHARYSRWIEDEMTLAKRAKARGRLIVLDRETRTRCDLVANEEGLDIAGLTPDEAAKVVIRRLKPARHPVNLPVAPGTSVAALLHDALEANLGIPSDAITDKIFVSPEAGRLAAAAYTKALDDMLFREDPDRLRAALEYARLQRFRGEWEQAVRILQLHIDSAREDAALYPIYRLDLGALQFECNGNTHPRIEGNVLKIRFGESIQKFELSRR